MTGKDLKEIKAEYLKMLKLAMEEAKKHVEPSPETREKLDALTRADQEQNIILAKQGKDIDGLKTDITSLRSDVKYGFEKIEALIIGCEKKYAAKWVERILTWGGGIAGSMIIVALISLILKK